MQATVFVTTGFCDDDPAVRLRFQELRGALVDEVRPLSWTQVRELQSAGLEIGAHTYSHPNLIRLSREDAERELRVSRELLEDRLSSPIDLMAYPFGKPGRQFDGNAGRAGEIGRNIRQRCPVIDQRPFDPAADRVGPLAGHFDPPVRHAMHGLPCRQFDALQPLVTHGALGDRNA